MALSDRSIHFVATIKVEKIDRFKDPNTADGHRDRTVDEVTHLTIKAKSLESLKNKITAHIKLVEED